MAKEVICNRINDEHGFCKNGDCILNDDEYRACEIEHIFDNENEVKKGDKITITIERGKG